MMLAVLTVVVASVTTGGMAQARVRAASKDLVAALRYTRTQAIVKREPQFLTLDVERRAYQAADRDWVELPKEMELAMTTAAQEVVEEGVARIRFFPDGASTGGHVEVIRGEAVWRIDVSWLTGEVRMHAGSPD
ncbi:GspH/FimT family pseudopilin [Pseudoxanthomonas sp. CAU 1598]|uniref:GspH/FimT family pseudopilin n=2 Tax=Pseudomarimonas arenosa TaxID=2774145 RepID=A0AAW3ZMN5_9GAMM|nr:GspH/FimT family pseudopilin [Pseudomarimonas arenosa]